MQKDCHTDVLDPQITGKRPAVPELRYQQMRCTIMFVLRLKERPIQRPELLIRSGTTPVT